MTTTILNHPVLKTKISLLRDIKTSNQNFRLLTNQIASLIAVYATQSLESASNTSLILNSPLSPFLPDQLVQKIGLFPILRSGLGMTDPFLDLIPDAIVHHLGLYREKSTFCPVEYYNKLPRKCVLDVGFVLDPMIATAGTAIAAVNILKEWGLKEIVFCCVLTSDAGLKALQIAHPDIKIFVGGVDAEMNAQKYLLPGIGDAGDRLFNTHK